MYKKFFSNGLSAVVIIGFLAAVTVGSPVYVLAAEADAAPAAPSALKAVDPELVCMGNDKVMDAKQIPIPIGDKIYYGCCQGCVESINNNPAARLGKDPLTGRSVDKAEAYIIEGPSGAALYFESRDTAEKYLNAVSGDGGG